MSTTVILFEVLMGLGVVFFIIVLILSFLKKLKKDRFPQWKFLDYFSVGYLDHLYKKYIKRI